MQPDKVIELQDWMKLQRLVGTGGEAKRVIQAGEVQVNVEVETRRRRKLHAGDTVEYRGTRHAVHLETPEP